MSHGLVNPALGLFIGQLDPERVVAQVIVSRSPQGYELRHVQDRERPAPELREVAIADLRQLAQFTALGTFRPLKSAPNLRDGWRSCAATDEQLEEALHHLYPGFLADWLACQPVDPPVTSYRDFTARQTGMYRITQKLSDAQVAETVAACCHPRFCLKRRLWSAEEAPPEGSGSKSIVPCLEPCAIMLEFARKVMRIEQAAQSSVRLSQDDWQSVEAVLRSALLRPGLDREADFGSAENPRRLHRVLTRIEEQLETGKPITTE